MKDTDTIVAVATPPGVGAVAIVRLSGPGVRKIATAALGSLPPPRQAKFHRFRDAKGNVIDEGLALFFTKPNSFNGEDVLEFHVHGSSVVVDRINKLLLSLGARLAEPGEFSRRAFCNGKYDLLQLEGIADLITSAGVHAAKSAQRSLQGEFSQTVRHFGKNLDKLRVEVEAAIDFADEIHYQGEEFSLRLRETIDGLEETLRKAKRGKRLSNGAQVAITGRPNVGKSTLFNCLAQRDEAIVSEVAGTTRDVLRCETLLSGVPITLCDAAGLREEATDNIEVLGMERARNLLWESDLALVMTDAPNGIGAMEEELISTLRDKNIATISVVNKSDLASARLLKKIVSAKYASEVIMISAKNRSGIDLLIERMLRDLDAPGEKEDVFLARRRHIDALKSALKNLHEARGFIGAEFLELAAESLRQAREALARLVGEQTNEDLLGEIFSTFCVGK